jgi:prepilin-type N-terminal cleavage/methylation domain-containing protein
MNVLQRTRNQAARGLTLIELVVVLAILVALVGLVLAFFPGLLGRASSSTSASSAQDIARAAQINYTTTLSYGTDYDSLLNAASGNTIYNSIPAPALAQLTPHTLTQDDVDALARLGINSVRHLNTVTGDATFNVSAATSTPLISGGSVASVSTINGATVQTALRGNVVAGANPVYVVFGVNKFASIVGVGRLLQDAPVRAGASATENPSTSYQRYGLAFLVDGTGAARTARFLGAVSFTATGIATAEGNLQQYYSN